MVTQVLMFLAGAMAVQQWSAIPDISWILAAIIALAVLAMCRWWHGMFFVLGMTWAAVFATNRLDQRLPESLAGQDIQIQGIISDLPETESNYTRFNFTVNKSNKAIPDKLRLTWYYPEQAIKAGQEWQLTARLKPPHGNFNPGGFDYERWLFVEGIGASGYVRPRPEPRQQETRKTTASLAAWRQQIADRLDYLLINNNSLPMIKALTLGDGNSLTTKQWEVFRETGTTHLMVISGSHIGLIAGLVYLSIIKLWTRTKIMAWSPQTVAAISAVLAAVWYAGLTGFSVPAQRAALMVAIAMIAIIQQRHTQPYHILALALLAVLIIDPLVVLMPGFWLSFIAVGLIIYTLAGRLEKPGFFRGSIKIIWVTSLGLIPLTLFFFQQVSLIAPLANLLAVPVISLMAVPIALLATLILLISPLLATKLFIVVDITLQGLWWVLTKLAALPISTIAHPQPSWWALLFSVPGILLLLAPKGIPARSLGLILLFPLIFNGTKKLEPGAFTLNLLDVGQGLSAVVQTENHVLVYDTGAKFSATSDSGQSVLIPFLRNQGIEKINTLIISHGDNDHIGGANSLLSAVKTEQIITSVPALMSQYAPVPCTTGQTWVWDNVTFAILSPRPDKFMSENDNSCVLHIKSKHGSALLPGDIEAEAETWLVDNYNDKLKADLLIAPHHGSHTSSTLHFLNSVNPNTILIPAGYRNPFGHPHDEVLARYRNLKINWFNSSDDGAVIADINQHLTITSWRHSAGKYWNFNKK
ncbi:ComE operon protein 3 [biofilm metagenome]